MRKGGLGQVWLAMDGDLNRPVALKQLRPERVNDPALAARFLEEAQVTGQLEHPGIVPVYELARRTSDGRPFECVEQLFKLYDAWGKPDKAARWRAELAAAADPAVRPTAKAGNGSGAGY